MNVLVVMPYSPVPPLFGGALRSYHLVKNLARRHDVTVLVIGTPADGGSIAREFRLHGDRIRVVPKRWLGTYPRLGQLYAVSTGHSYFHSLVGRHAAMQELLDRVLEKGAFDIVQTEFTPMGCYRLGTGAVRILDAHNVEFDNYRRMSLHASSLFRKKYYGRESRLLRLEEAEACRRHDAIFATSERDRRLLETLVPGVPKFVIPNGVDPSYFTPAAGSPEPASLVFSGMMAYVPNNDGMLYFLDEIFPLIRAKVPGLKVYIVGNRPPKSLLERASESVIVTGYVEDVRPFISKASVYIVPLRMGSGTRLKILEAMSMGKPVVTTSIGCEGLDVVNGETAVIADDPLSFAGSVVDLLGDGQMRERLSRNGMELVRQKYDWSVVDGLVEEAYLGLRRGAAPGAGAERERAKTPVPSVSH